MVSLLSPDELIPSFRFSVTFLVPGTDDQSGHLDIRFQRVSGIKASINVNTITEGGHNLYVHRQPGRVEYGNLVLERGFVVGSSLNLELKTAMETLQLTPSDVLVSLLRETRQPLAAWKFHKAFPVSWATADLDATQEQVLIDTIELAYSHMEIVDVP